MNKKYLIALAFIAIIGTGFTVMTLLRVPAITSTGQQNPLGSGAAMLLGGVFAVRDENGNIITLNQYQDIYVESTTGQWVRVADFDWEWDYALTSTNPADTITNPTITLTVQCGLTKDPIHRSADINLHDTFSQPITSSALNYTFHYTTTVANVERGLVDGDNIQEGYHWVVFLFTIDAAADLNGQSKTTSQTFLCHMPIDWRPPDPTDPDPTKTGELQLRGTPLLIAVT